jgi:hypothetical protein
MRSSFQIALFLLTVASSECSSSSIQKVSSCEEEEEEGADCEAAGDAANSPAGKLLLQRSRTGFTATETLAPASGDSFQPQPVLQLKQHMMVYLLYANKDTTVYETDRDVQLLREGIQMHPFIEKVGEGPGDTEQQKDAANRADFILYLVWDAMSKEKCNESCPDLLRLKLVPEKKLAVLDWSDGFARLPWMPPAKIIFKRSLVHKTDGSFIEVAEGCRYNDPHPCFPLDYAIRPGDYLGLTSKSVHEERNPSVVFLTEPYDNMREMSINQISAVRLRVKHWLLEMKLPNTSFVGYSHSSA